MANTILDKDILYQDDLVCILKPNVKKGILIWTKFTQPKNTDSLCELGLKTGSRLHKEEVKFGRKIYHPYIFFRAPYKSGPVDYTNIETEIESLYGHNNNIASRVFIRVDPDKTYVFSSEIRSEFSPKWPIKYDQAINKEVDKSKKTLSQYLTIINSNDLQTIPKPGNIFMYHLYTSEKKEFPLKYNLEYPWNNYNISRNSEILVQIPHLEQKYFVKCNPSEEKKPPSRLSRKNSNSKSRLSRKNSKSRFSNNTYSKPKKSLYSRISNKKNKDKTPKKNKFMALFH